jgi:very-short-patch-repair endonuclease
METALAAWWERVRRLDQEYREYSTIGSPRADERKAAARKRAYYEITQDPDRAYTLNYLATAGLLPAYQFPTDTFALDPGVDDTPTLYRAASIAIEEFAPGNLVYANGHKLLSIRALFAGGPGRPGVAGGRTDLEASGRVRSFYFCPQCDFGSEQVLNHCPRCGAAMGEDVSVAFLESFEAEEFTRITSDEEQRERRFFIRRETLLDDESRPCQIYAYPFVPLEYRPSSSILITNWGRGEFGAMEGERFRICPECGRHRPPHPNDERGEPSPWDEQHARFCHGQPELVVLGYQFETDVLAASIPAEPVASAASAMFDEALLRTVAEALLVGATERLEVEPGEVGAFVRRAGSGRIQAQVILYETVPGGAGYLEEMARELPQVAHAAYDRLFGHVCRRACYRCLKRYGNQRWHGAFDKERVRDLLFHLAQEPPLDGRPGTAGDGAEILAATLEERRQEVEAAQVERHPKTEPTPIERALLEAIRRRDDLPEPAAQHEVRDGDRLVTVPDYAYPDLRIAIFCDGYMYHGNPDTLEADAQKRNFLQSQGWVVLTYWGRTILRKPDVCSRQIASVYQSRSESG